jgi:hypothetical protein
MWGSAASRPSPSGGASRESDYFDDDPDNDRTLIAGLSAVFEPAFARGLFIGVNRMYLADMEGGDLTRYFIDPYVDVRDNPIGDNQLFSLFARWVLPRSGFEVYAEWAREDHWGDWIDLLREPDHSQAYMLGFQKIGTLGRRPAAVVRRAGPPDGVHDAAERTGRGVLLHARRAAARDTRTAASCWGHGWGRDPTGRCSEWSG